MKKRHQNARARFGFLKKTGLLLLGSAVAVGLFTVPATAAQDGNPQQFAERLATSFQKVDATLLDESTGVPASRLPKTGAEALRMALPVKTGWILS